MSFNNKLRTWARWSKEQASLDGPTKQCTTEYWGSQIKISIQSMWLSPLCLLPFNFFQLLTYGDLITCSKQLAERTVFNCQSSLCIGMCDTVELCVLQSSVQTCSNMIVHTLSIFRGHSFHQIYPGRSTTPAPGFNSFCFYMVWN